jgi:hypothetical protein
MSMSTPQSTCLRDARHLRGPPVVCELKGQPLTEKIIRGLTVRMKPDTTNVTLVVGSDSNEV